MAQRLIRVMRELTPELILTRPWEAVALNAFATEWKRRSSCCRLPIMTTISMERMKIFGYESLGCDDGLRSHADPTGRN